MKYYCVVYLSPGGIHYRYRCYAASATEAKRMCRENVGIAYADMIEVCEE